ncbi:MAG: glycosyltransferase [Lachnospiraceae bacterium]
MKIVLIGPVYPYKGGISHYTSLLCKALRKKHEVTMVSYKMQYPKLLFKKEQRDYSNKSFQIEDTQYWINTANPFNIINTARRIRKLQPDIVIMQWWHPYFAPCYYLLARFLKHIPILFTCHNVFPHERFPMDRFLSRLVLRRGSGYIVQSHLDEADLLTVNPGAKYVVTPHPTYNAFKMQDMSREEARKLLDVDEQTPMLLFFGFVREYKGLKYLLDAMKKIKTKMPETQLWVVGDFGEDKEQYLKQIQDNDIRDQINLVEGYIPDKEVEKYFAAADLVVLPYISATQSGIVQIAYGFEKPVVVTDVGGLPDVVQDHKTGYVVPKENADAIADAVTDFFQVDTDIPWKECIREQAGEFSWETMVERMEALVHRIERK